MIAVVGESLVERVVDADGDLLEAVGGSALNVTVGLGRLETPAVLLTQTGNDEHGARVLSAVTTAGAEIVVAPTSTGRTATSTARLDRSGTARYEFDLDWSLPAQQLPPCDALHVGALGTVLEPGRTTVLDLVDQAFALDVAVSFDVNVRPAFVVDPDQLWRDVEALAERCRVVKLSTEDVAALLPGAEPADIARSLLTSERTELVLLTDGAAGATAFVDGLSVTVAAPKVEVVDTVGAGDAFMAAVLTVLFDQDALGPYGSGIPEGEEQLHRLLLAANEAAAFTCAKRGAQPPTRPELHPGWPY